MLIGAVIRHVYSAQLSCSNSSGGISFSPTLPHRGEELDALHAPSCSNGAMCILLSFVYLFPWYHFPLLQHISWKHISSFYRFANVLIIAVCVCSLCSLRSPLRSEVTKCRGELASKDSELQRLRKDVDDKMRQVRCRDESLQHMKKQLDSKSDTGICTASVHQVSVPFYWTSF